jgi:hypothetical protein
MSKSQKGKRHHMEDGYIRKKKSNFKRELEQDGRWNWKQELSKSKERLEG